MDLQQNQDFIETTLSNYFIRNKGEDGLGLTNEIIGLTHEFQNLMDKDQMTIQGGKDCKIATLMRTGAVKGFVSPYKVREVRQAQHTVSGTIPWSVYEANWHIEEIEQDLNDAGFAQLFDDAEIKEEGMITEAAEDLEAIFFSATGNADLLAAEDPPFPGLKYWVTRNGFAVDGTTSLAGIDTLTDKRWLNRYCGPLGSNFNKDFTHDATDTLTNGSQLRRKMRKAIRYCRFGSPNGAKYAHDDKNLMVNKQKIYCDEIAIDALEVAADATGHGNDNIAPAETARPDPIFKGVPFTFVEHLGVGSSGLPSYVMSSASKNTTRGDFSATQYANTGEVFILNLRNLKVVGKKGNTPKRKPVHFNWDQQLMIQLYRWIMTVVCNSRQRQVCLWGFSPALAA